MSAFEEKLQHFVSSLKEVRQEAGSPSFGRLVIESRDLSGACDAALSTSALSRVLRGDIQEPPSWSFVDLFLTTCQKIARKSGRPIGSQLVDPGLWRVRHAVLEALHEEIRRNDGAPLPPGLRPFPLEGAPPLAKHPMEQPSQLLLAHHEIVPFTGRVDELKALSARMELSAADGEPVTPSVTLLHGQGGLGKTRLAVELARRSAKGRWRVWQATQTSAVPQVAPGGLGRRALVVVDHAERWPSRDLTSLLANLALARGKDQELRVLLIARSPGWWSLLLDDLREQGYAQDDILLKPTDEADLKARALAFTTARDRFAEVLGLPPRHAAAIAVPDNLDHEAYGLTLTVHMAALVAVYARTSDGGEPPRDPGALSGYLLDRERGHWAKLARPERGGVAVDVMAQAVYTATLARPRPYETALSALRAAEVELPDQHPRLLAEHSACYPAAESEERLQPLYPDRLGEDFVALSTPGAPHPGHFVLDWARRAPARLLGVDPAGGREGGGDERDVRGRARPPGGRPAGEPAAEWHRDVLTTLINAAARWPHLATGELAPLALRHPEVVLRAGNAALSTLATIRALPLEALEAVEMAAPRQDADIDVGIADITERVTDARILTTSDPSVTATLHARKASRLSRAGRHDEALGAITRAVEIHRHLARGGGADEVADLAWALKGMSDELARTGRRRAALEAAEESVVVLTELVRLHPEKIGSLAAAFNSLSLRLAALGRTEQGVGLLEEAVRITRLTAEVSPDDYQPDLAGMLHNLGSHLRLVGRYREAQETETEAVSLYRRLVGRAPAVHRADLAAALDGLAIALGDEGRHSEALAPGGEAVTLLRVDAEGNPRAHAPALANALLNHGICCGETGSWREAVRHCHEAVEAFRELTAVSPSAHLPALARAVMALGVWLGKCGQHAEAVEAAREAVALFRELARDDPDHYLPSLAEALLNAAPRLVEARQPEEGRAAARESVEIYRRVGFRPGTPRCRLAIALVTLGNTLARSDDVGEAVACFREAAEVAREVARGNPGVGAPLLASALVNLARSLGASGLPAVSVSTAHEAVGLLRSLSERGDAAHQPELATALVVYCDGLGSVGRHAAAADAGEQAVLLTRQLAEALPEAHRPALAAALRSLGRPLAALGRRRQALAAAEEEVGVRRALSEADAQQHVFDLGAALQRYSTLLAEEGRYAEAVTAGEEAASLWRDTSHPGAEEMLPLSLCTLGRLLTVLGRHDEAVALGEEAVRAWRRLADRDPVSHRPHLVMGLFYALGLPLAERDRWQRAEVHLREAVDLQRRLAKEDAAAHRPHLAHMLNAVALVRTVRRHGLPEALAAAEESVDLYGSLAERDLETFRTPLQQAFQLRARLRAEVQGGGWEQEGGSCSGPD
ncbi:tetratricopeptide repeat protein [Streptomyces lavendulocolor]|uniref:tetratricopeptide repeat protein n=1 Tax=Streptomyces lavendulocolor TaxID=67316 RepID=UPI003C2E3C98